MNDVYEAIGRFIVEIENLPVKILFDDLWGNPEDFKEAYEILDSIKERMKCTI